MIPVVYDLDRESGGPTLNVDRWSDSNRFLYSLKLVNLSSNEIGLSDGRFSLYRPQEQENRINLPGNNMTSGGLRNWFETLLNWIASQSEHPWSVSVTPIDADNHTFVFSFEDLETAISFALCFK